VSLLNLLKKETNSVLLSISHFKTQNNKMKNIIILILLTCLFTSCVFSKEKLFVITGQSNAMRVGDKTKSIFENSLSFEYDSRMDSIIPLKNPVGQNHLKFQKAKTGSFIPSFLYYYTLNDKHKSFIVQREVVFK
jgi:hypothetical protein